MVLDVAGEVHSAGPMHRAVNLHVAVDEVQVFLLVLKKQGHRMKTLTQSDIDSKHPRKEPSEGNS